MKNIGVTQFPPKRIPWKTTSVVFQNPFMRWYLQLHKLQAWSLWTLQRFHARSGVSLKYLSQTNMTLENAHVQYEIRLHSWWIFYCHVGFGVGNFCFQEFFQVPLEHWGPQARITNSLWRNWYGSLGMPRRLNARSQSTSPAKSQRFNSWKMPPPRINYHS